VEPAGKAGSGSARCPLRLNCRKSSSEGKDHERIFLASVVVAALMSSAPGWAQVVTSRSCPTGA